VNRFFQELRNTFLAGLAVLIPAGVTFWVVVSFAQVVDGVLDLLPLQVHPEVVLGAYLNKERVPLPGLGILIAIVFVMTAGLAMRAYTGRKLYAWFEAILLKVPVFSGIYQGLKKLVDTIFGSDSMRFRQVVMVEYPRRGAWAIAFLTGDALYLETGREFEQDQPVSIFLPTTPNPTSGFYLVLPARDVRRLDISVEEAFKIIMSAGIVVPDAPRRLRGLDELPPPPSDPPDSRLDETLDAELGAVD
jgi:uncharacterized membrane protein